MTSHLLLISLGPVQDFIASARRCQDLWFGSWLLSDLARATANSLQSSCAEEESPLIFPADLDVEKKPAVANKILAVIKLSKESAEIANRARLAMMARLKEISDWAFLSMTKEYFNRELAEAQLKDLIEFQWVSVPFADNYEAARDKAERLMAARKNTRNWTAVPWHKLAGKGVPKSSLDGLRESVIDEKAYDVYRKTPEKLRREYQVKKGERLCGVGLLKRLGAEPPTDSDNSKIFMKKPAFHSTSHVASQPILSRMKLQGTGVSEYQNYLNELKSAGVDLERFRISSGDHERAEITNPLDNDSALIDVPRTYCQSQTQKRGYDGYLLFESRIPELISDYCKSSDENDETKVRKLTEAQRTFRRKIGLKDNHTAYYAYVLADGDSMGKAIDVLAKQDNGIRRHRDLGKALDEFSGSCLELVEKSGGSLIYAGGDDVLALCPLHTVLHLARSLRDRFNECMAKAIPDETSVKQIDKSFILPTLSVGLGISHHMEPMDRARALAKQAERAAKDSGRNALAIVVEKRSGGKIEVSRKWSDDDSALDKWLIKLCKWLHNKYLPHGFAFDLEQMLAPFDIKGADSVDHQDFSQIVQSLARGILARKQASEEVCDEIGSYLSKRDPDGSFCKKAIARLSEEIQVARLFLGAFEDAFILKTEKELPQ